MVHSVVYNRSIQNHLKITEPAGVLEGPSLLAWHLVPILSGFSVRGLEQLAVEAHHHPQASTANTHTNQPAAWLSHSVVGVLWWFVCRRLLGLITTAQSSRSRSRQQLALGSDVVVLLAFWPRHRRLLAGLVAETLRNTHTALLALFCFWHALASQRLPVAALPQFC
ncbi:uncharacterized protein DS421_9g263960 [Arachis hypogaea]|nr:uncharacterized protein DS421_9g263960 [Arachis hypogaea]